MEEESQPLLEKPYAASRLHKALRMLPCKVLYFLYYGSKFILMTFLIPFLISIGMSPARAGLIVGIQYGMSSVGGAFFGFVITKTKKYTLLTVVFILISTAAVLCIAFVPYYLQQLYTNNEAVVFISALIFCSMYAIFDDTILGMKKAFVLAYCSRYGEKYATQRMFGSFGYAVLPFVTGIVLQVVKVSYIAETLPAILMYVVFQIPMLPLVIPLSRHFQMNVEREQKATQSTRQIFSTFLNPYLVLCFVMYAFFGVCNAVEYGFLFTYMKFHTNNGTPFVLGLSLLFQSVMETVFSPVTGSLLERFGKPYFFIAIGALGYSISFLMYYFTTNALYFIGINCVIGITHTCYMYAITNEVNRMVPIEQKAFFFTLSGSCFNGVGQGLGTVVAGFVFQSYAGGLFLGTSVAAFVASLAVLVVACRRNSMCGASPVVVSINGETVTYSLIREEPSDI